MPKPLAAEGADTKFNSKNNQKQSQYSQVPIFNSVTSSLIFGFEVNPAFFFKLLTLVEKAVLNEMVSVQPIYQKSRVDSQGLHSLGWWVVTGYKSSSMSMCLALQLHVAGVFIVCQKTNILGW